MLVKMVMELEDVPGQLLKGLEPIARFGGNIKSIMHRRERKTPLGRLPVMLIFEVRDQATLKRILAALKQEGVRVTQVGEREGEIVTTVLLVGHIVHTDIRQTIDQLNAIKGVNVSELNLAVGNLGHESSARMIIAADDKERSMRAISKLRDIAERRNLLLVTSIEAVQ
ncbi:MAG: amino acid-binding protein [Candidatus Hadarchaeaceae archaeon]